MLRKHLVGATVLATLLIPFGATARAADSSPEGRWERVPFAATGFEPGADVRSIVPFHGQLFAAGWVTTFQRGNPNALWRSSDGHRWERIEPTPFGATTVEQLVATPAGLLTFGQASSHDGRGPTSIWRSTDGLSWQLVTSSAPWGIRMIVAAPAGLVAAGVDDASGCGSPPLACTSSAIWSSRDGSTWTKAEGGASVFPRGSVVGVVRAGRGLVAVGFRQDGVTKHTTATIVWTSPDGATWRRRPARELGTLGAFPGLLAARARRVLLVGEARSSQPPPSTTTTPPTTVRTADGATQARLCFVSTGVTGAWTTTDASTWARSPAAPLDDVGVSQLVATHGRWLVGGYRGDCTSSRAILYASADGRRWHETIADADDVNAVNPQTRMPLALAATPAGAIAAVTPFGDLAGGPDIWIWSAPAKR